ncbi:HD family phosphohydrolase [Thermodesulfobacteriota bacterium]
MDIDKRKQSAGNLFSRSRSVRWVLLAAITVIFTVILSPNLVRVNPTYYLGDVVDRDIKAPKDFFVEDVQATEANRREAVARILTVYDHDVTLVSKLTRRVNSAFEQVREAVENEKKKVGEMSEGTEGIILDTATRQKRIQALMRNKKAEFEKAMGITVSKGAYTILVKDRFAAETPTFINRILSEILGTGVVTNKDILLREADSGITLRSVESKDEIVVKGLKQFYGLDQALTMVRVIGQPLLKKHNYTLRNLIVDFVQQLIQPNITLNKSETEERKKAAIAEIKPVLHLIKAGEMILREGERVTDVHLLKLKKLQVDSRKDQLVASSGSAAIIILCLLLTTYVLYANRQARDAPDHNKNLLFLAFMLVVFLLLARISASVSETMLRNFPYAITVSVVSFAIPLAAGAMSVCLFLGLNVALPFALVLAVSTAFIFQNRFELFVYFLISSTMAAYWIQDCKERKVFITAGLKLGFLNIVLTAAINFYMQSAFGIQLLWNCAFALMGGIGAGIITAGIAPMIEIAFGYKTDSTLLELANLDRPILRKLMIEAPGTYHHSVIVGSLVEAAASEINAKPLLAKVCGYYHDVGKIKQPLYFIENQSVGKNKHDKLAPSMSSLILIAHIKNGVEIARENRLGQEIIHTIRQHHGTSLIRYFYEKAKQLKGEDAVDIGNFRYPGPKPQTKEAGLVMLADVVEAALRTLENPTPSRIQGQVQNLINKVFSDGQLDNCELTLKDLDNIAKSFNKILNGIYHHRIEYTESSAAVKGKGKNGGPDRKQAKQTRDTDRENGTESSGHLKRLGLS